MPVAKTQGMGGRRHKLAPSDRRHLERGRSLRLNLIVAVSAAVINPAPVDAGYGATAPYDAIRVYKESGMIVDINFRLRNCLVSDM